MAITQLGMLEPTSENDIVTRQRAEHAAMIYDKAVFVTRVVTVDFGPSKKQEKVTLRFEVGSGFAFAVYRENPTWQDRGREEWTAAAGDALEKFCAVNDLAILAGPRPEITNRYNLFVEVRGRIEA
jgi:hypothetical protein